MTTFDAQRLNEPLPLTEREDAANVPLISIEEAKELIEALLVELSGSEINYPENVARIEADAIVSSWLAGDGVSLF